jgi:hypothetical protein
MVAEGIGGSDDVLGDRPPSLGTLESSTASGPWWTAVKNGSAKEMTHASIADTTVGRADGAVAIARPLAARCAQAAVVWGSMSSGRSRIRERKRVKASGMSRQAALRALDAVLAARGAVELLAGRCR